MGFLMDFVILMKPHPHNIFKLFVLYLGLSLVQNLIGLPEQTNR
jgi:hypothetical protein